VQYSVNGSTWTTFAHAATTATTATITGLANGTAYVVRVAAVNAVGQGSWSSPSTSVSTTALPGAPTGVAGVGGDAQVALTWSAPAIDGGAAVTDYVVQQSVRAPGRRPRRASRHVRLLVLRQLSQARQATLRSRSLGPHQPRRAALVSPTTWSPTPTTQGTPGPCSQMPSPAPPAQP
jgi:hypothetical protein